MIKFTNVTKIFKKQNALDSFNWEVKKGEIHALLGHNGAGKTTSFLIANSILDFNSGSIKIFGKDIKKLKKDDIRNIGLLTEKIKLYKDLNAKEILSFFCEIYNIKNRKQKIKEFIQLFNLSDYETKKVKDLSTGMYKKLAIAVTFLNNPEIIFLDEPFSGLDPLITKEIIISLLNYKEKYNKTIVISSHNLTEVEMVSDRITIMKDGKDIVSGSFKELSEKYGIKRSFDISYFEDKHEKVINVKDENKLADKLNELKEQNIHISQISEKKISLSEIYNKIYS